MHAEAIDAVAGGTFGSIDTNANGYLVGAQLLGGAGAGTAIIREVNGSGKVLAALGAGAGLSAGFHPSRPVRYKGALHVTVAGAPAQLTIYQG